MTVLPPRVRRLFLLLLLTCTTATAFSADSVDPAPMPRARQVRVKRLRLLQQRIVRLDEALRCSDSQGKPLPEPAAPLVLPRNVRLAIPLPAAPLPLHAYLGQLPLHTKSEPHALVVTLPEVVCSGPLTLRLAGQVVWERQVFVTLSAPLEPQLPPWRGVLDDACTWAAGAQSQAEVAERLTQGLFESGRFVYPLNDPVKLATFVRGDAFSLTELFQHLGPSLANCVDVSDYLTICASALGVSMEILQLSDSEARPFITHPVCPIGWDPSDPASYQTLTLEMHQLAVLSSSGRLYDPTFVPLFADPASPIGALDHLVPFWQSSDGLSGLIREPLPSHPRLGAPVHTPSIR